MLILIVCVVQAPQTLGGRSGKGGPGEGLFVSSDASLSKNQDDYLCLCWCHCHGGIISGSGNFFSVLISTAPVLPILARSTGLL